MSYFSHTDDVDFNVHPREPNTPSRRHGERETNNVFTRVSCYSYVISLSTTTGDMDSELGSTRTHVADSSEATSLTSPFSHTTPHSGDHTTESGTSLHHSVPTNYDYSEWCCVLIIHNE